ncbi:hypothetical protein KIW84_043820 [Lathyrus oleraceus]|uniref:NAD-dependent epimerase/dehydratase domain-containing protein n=1 Tax=Pisum sativum TaxID=3888 RepID=A0A9D4XJ15_PEA|nr:hypothetical protein KIW84_043820 [Pisum sativum]
MTSGEGKVVCVTGGSGFIASWIVKFLLQRGYTVRATVRDPSNPKKVDHLFKLDGAKERLQLFKADLLEQGSFDTVVEGCDGVFHTASPVSCVIDNPQAKLIDPAVKGTLNVLRSCAKSPSVKPVVLTSSNAAVSISTRPKNPQVIINETWFSDPDFCRKLQLWYILSKTLAEAAAWEFVNENKIDMVVINPTMVAGPVLQPEVNESFQPILDIINGNFYLGVFGRAYLDLFHDIKSKHQYRKYL